MGLKLYEIDRQIAELLENVDPETGELLIDSEALEALQMERESKLENIALAVKNISAEAEAIGAEIANLTARKKSAEAKARRLRDYLGEALAGEKLQTARVAVSFRSSRSVAVDDGFLEWARAHGDRFLKYSEPAIDKKALGDCLKAGEEVPFAHLESKSNIQIK